MSAPRSVPRAAHALEAVLVGLVSALLLGVLGLPITPRLLLALLGLGAFCALAIPVQVHCWGTFIAPALTRSRISYVVFILAMSMTLSSVPDDAPLGWRAAATILLPCAFYVLARWDDARTVELLRARAPIRFSHGR
ncbi:MAG: hypothetical protein L0G94_01450 [Brachybacterium sp.]|uniref:hypothetical protein n=1 Tax=Brachybacterium sp. TaxID=1891286 RepID=UPI002647811F|nr:hypothetical protein [Brachybacterium sp.]MDN5685335.1 hypothetical protein [Brachybacterium sp.]